MVERNAEARSRVWGLSSGLFIGLLQLIPRSRPAPDQHVCENFRAGVWDNAALGLSVNMKPRLASSAPPVHQFLICGNNLNAHRCISVKKKITKCFCRGGATEPILVLFPGIMSQKETLWTKGRKRALMEGRNTEQTCRCWDQSRGSDAAVSGWFGAQPCGDNIVWSR